MTAGSVLPRREGHLSAGHCMCIYLLIYLLASTPHYTFMFMHFCAHVYYFRIAYFHAGADVLFTCVFEIPDYPRSS